MQGTLLVLCAAGLGLRSDWFTLVLEKDSLHCLVWNRA